MFERARLRRPTWTALSRIFFPVRDTGPSRAGKFFAAHTQTAGCLKDIEKLSTVYIITVFSYHSLYLYAPISNAAGSPRTLRLRLVLCFCSFFVSCPRELRGDPRSYVFWYAAFQNTGLAESVADVFFRAHRPEDSTWLTQGSGVLPGDLYFRSRFLLTSMALCRRPCPLKLGGFPSAGLPFVVTGTVLPPGVHCQVVSDERRVRAFMEYILKDASAFVSTLDLLPGGRGGWPWRLKLATVLALPEVHVPCGRSLPPCTARSTEQPRESSRGGSSQGHKAGPLTELFYLLF